MEIIFLLTMGLVLGSFISVYTHRSPRFIDWTKGRSFCPNCQKPLGWKENIPLISFILLKGRCRKCKKKISLRYPLIELASAGGILSTWFLFRSCLLSFPCQFISLPGFAGFFLTALLFLIVLAIFITDIESRVIPDELSLLGFILVFLALLLGRPGILFKSLFSGFFVASLLLFLHIITKGKGMGLGDVKLAVFLGTFFGFPWALIWLMVAFLTGGLVASILVLTRKTSMNEKIAFGPFLIISAFLVFLFGDFFLKIFKL